MENKPLLRSSDLESEELAAFTASKQQLSDSVSDSPSDNNLALAKDDDIRQRLFATTLRVNKRSQETITLPEPMIKQDGNGVIFPYTINMIQGQTGVHKSRLVENICAAILRKSTCTEDLLGFEAYYKKKIKILYVDTERNLQDQLPLAIQKIRLLAGYDRADTDVDLVPISLIEFGRHERFKALKIAVNDSRKASDKSILIVLDVVSDCVSDFNRSDASVELIDMMNDIIASADVTFLVVLHENYGSEKARGHLGSELYNKCSTVIQIGAERDSSNDTAKLFKVRYLKCRNSKRYEPFYVCYDEELSKLVLAGSDEVSELKKNQQMLAPIDGVIEELEKHLSDSSLSGKELISHLERNFGTSDRTIRERLRTIERDKTPIYVKGIINRLVKQMHGREAFYALEAINPPKNDTDDISF